MSAGNGANGHAPAKAEARAREHLMMSPRRDVTVVWEGEEIRLAAATDRIGADHPIVIERPELFKLAPPSKIGGRGVEDRQIDVARVRQPAPRLSLAEELRVRSSRLAELEQRERDRQADPAHLAETEFWCRVDRLLGNPARAREDQEAMKSFEAWGTRTHGFADDSLADWLDQ